MDRLNSGPVAHLPVQGGAKPLPLQADSAPARRYEVGPPALPRLRQTGAWEKVKDLALRFAVKVAPSLVRSDFMCRRAEQAMGPKVRDLAIALGKQPTMTPVQLADRLEDIRGTGFALRSRDHVRGEGASAYTQGLEAAIKRSVSQLDAEGTVAMLFGAMDAIDSLQLQPQADGRPLRALLDVLGLSDCKAAHETEMAQVNPMIKARSAEYLPEQQEGDPELTVSKAFMNDFMRATYTKRTGDTATLLIEPQKTKEMSPEDKKLAGLNGLREARKLFSSAAQFHAASCVSDQRGFTGIINAQAERMGAGEKSLTRGAGVSDNENKHWTFEALSDGSVLVRGITTSTVDQVMDTVGEIPKPIKPTYQVYAYEARIDIDGTVTPGRAFSAHGPIEKLAS